MIIGILVVIIAAAVGLAGVFILPGALETEPEQSALVTSVAAFWPDLAKKQSAFHDAIKAIRPSKAGDEKGATLADATKLRIDAARQAGRETLKVVTTAETSLKEATTATPQETAAKEATLQALAADRAYIQAIGSLPKDPLDLKTGDVGKARQAEMAALAAFNGLGDKYLALTEPYRLPGVITLTSSELNRLRETAKRMGEERVFVAFLRDANEVLLKAGPGQQDLNDGIDATTALASSDADRNPDTAEPYAALDYFSSAMANRQEVLDAVDGLEVPDDERAVEIAQQMQATFQSSETALERWYEWSSDVADRFTRYTFLGEAYKGLRGKDPQDFDSYDIASSADSTAGSLQDQLAKMMNRYNRLYGLPDKDWSASNM